MKQRAFYTGQDNAVSPRIAIDAEAASSGQISVQGHLQVLVITVSHPVRRCNT